MIRIFVVVVFGIMGFLTCGCVTDNVEIFGRDGIIGIESKPCVFDFSKDGKLLWLSETNCYDLAGSKVDVSIVDDLSRPLTRLRWKKRILGSAWNYCFSNLSGGNGFDKHTIAGLITRWADDQDVVAREGKHGCLCVRWTFPEELPPILTAQLRVDSGHNGVNRLVRGSFSDSEEKIMPLQTVEVSNEQCLSLGWDWTLSVTMQRIASFSFIDTHDNPRIRFSDADILGTTNRLCMSNEVFITKADLARLVHDDGLMFNDLCGHGFFLNDNYFVFTGKNGGRNKFTARDYLFVYGFREKRIVKAFKSHLRFFDEGYNINDVDVVLSADEKYLAVRYDGVITVYPFRSKRVNRVREGLTPVNMSQ